MLARTLRATSSFLLLGFVLAASPPAAAQDACQGFDSKHTITRLGGPNAFAPGGVQTRENLQEYFVRHEVEIRSALESQGLGGEVADALFSAVRRNVGITERRMPEGELLEWMAYRKGGEIRTIDKICMKLPDSAPAFEITVVTAEAGPPVQPGCTLDVATECDPDGTSTFRVRTAPGATVTMEGPERTRTIVDGGESTWTGPIDDPYAADYSFTVTNEAATVETVTSYTFLVPRECMNLAFVGRSEEERAGEPATCREQRDLSQPVCPVPPVTCTIELDESEVRRGSEVGYRVTGEWAELDLELQLDGIPVTEPELTADSGSFVAEKRGTYTVVGTATNVVGDTHVCRASVDAVGFDWIVRPFGAYLSVDDERFGAAVVPQLKQGCPCPAGTGFGYDDGWGVGVNVERLFSDRIGLELRGLYGQLDDQFRIEANGLGIDESDDADYWNLSLGLNVHLTPSHRLDWYAGPFVGYGDIDGHESLAVDRSLEYEADGDVTWGAQTGLDWPFGASPWSLHLGARYTVFSADLTQRYTEPGGAVLEQSGSVDLDPITVELGVAYHF